MDVGTGKWKTGRPLDKCWYNASIGYCTISLRWWDGKNWGLSCFPGDDKIQAACRAEKAFINPTYINWRPLKKQYRK